MDFCILCLEGSDPSSSHNIGSNEEVSVNLQEIICKYLELQINISSISTICQLCRKSLLSFHKFYQRIHNAHERQLEIYPKIEIDLFEPHALDNIKTESESFDEDLPLAKRKHSRNFNQKVQPETITSVDLIVDTNDYVEKDIDPIGEKHNSDFVINKVVAIVNKKQRGRPKKHKSETKLEPKIVISNRVKSALKDIEVTKNFVESERDEVTNKSNSDSESDYKIKKSLMSRSNAEVSKQNDEFLAANYKLSCSLCNDTFQKFTQLLIHFRMIHKIRGFALCCGKKFFKRSLLVDHIRIHLNPNFFECVQCKKVMSCRRSLELHLKWHDAKKERNFACKICSKSFYRQEIYLRHIVLHVPKEKREFGCTDCDKRFATDYLRRQHHRLVHLNAYAKVCDMCGKSIRGGKQSFQRHMEEHTGVPRPGIQCEQCGVTLTTKYGLARHIKMMHTEENQKPQICTICSKVTPTLSSLKYHMKYAHIERKYACTMCEKAFKRPTDLKEHMATHTGEILYSCTYCSKTFNSNANMYSHRKKMHRKEWEEKQKQVRKPFELKKLAVES